MGFTSQFLGPKSLWQTRIGGCRAIAARTSRHVTGSEGSIAALSLPSQSLALLLLFPRGGYVACTQQRERRAQVMTQHVLHESPFQEDFIAELCSLAQRIFGEIDQEDIAWRLERMPDASVHVIASSDSILAFKFGYALTRTRYLSWLGGVDAQHRRRGLARELIHRQHTWVHERGYEFVETGAIKSNTAMLSLNLSVGFEIIGTYARTAVPRVMMQKRLAD